MLCITLNGIGSVLWNAPGVVSVLLYELTSTYFNIHPPTLTHYQVTRLCNTMNIINCIASDRATSVQFVEIHMPQYIFPFLHCKDNGRVTPLKCSISIVFATLLSVNTNKLKYFSTCYLCRILTLAIKFK